MKINVVDLNASTATADFVRSLKETGFAVLNNHPIDNQLVTEVYQEWDGFFNSDQKFNYLFHEIKQDGYFPFQSENAKGYSQKDLKEFYHIYPWGRYPTEISQNSQLLYDKLVEFAEKLLGWIEIETPESISQNFSIPLKDMIHESPRNLMRIIHYPALTGNENAGAVRAAAHEDINLITVLCAGTQPGLQAKDLHGNWHDVQCDPGMIVVNSGDMLKMCSNEYYPSTTHRVVNPSDAIPNESRLSLPLFLHPNDDVILSENYTAKSYLDERLKEIGLK